MLFEARLGLGFLFEVLRDHAILFEAHRSQGRLFEVRFLPQEEGLQTWRPVRGRGRSGVGGGWGGS